MRYLAWLAVLLSSCGATSDEQQILQVITRAESAAEDRNTAAVLALVADDYSDAQGFDKAQLRNFLRGYFLTHPKIELLVDVGAVEFETANRARVPVRVGMLGMRGVTQQRPDADFETLLVDLQRRDGEWVVMRANRRAQ
jgi:hypothetical protein